MRRDPSDSLPRADGGRLPSTHDGRYFRRLPPYQRTLFPKRRVEPPESSDEPPALCALADRLIREATR